MLKIPAQILHLGGDTVDYEKIGGLIRRLRLEQGLTQLQLAAQMGISDKTVSVSKRERGGSLR